MTKEYQFKWISADWMGRLIFFLLTSPVGILALLSLFRNPDPKFLLFGLVVVGLPQLWLASYRVGIKDGCLIYRELFSRKSICLRDIKKISIELGVKDKSRLKNKAFYRLVLHDQTIYKDDPFIINLKPFSRNDLAYLAKIIRSYAADAAYDSVFESLSEGNVQPLIGMAKRVFINMAVIILLTFLFLGLLGTLLSV